jgi:hypothetical protein
MNNFGWIPARIYNYLPLPALDVNQSGLVDMTDFQSLNVRGGYDLIIQSASLLSGRLYGFLNSGPARCSIVLDAGGFVTYDEWFRVVIASKWTIAEFGRADCAAYFTWDGTNFNPADPW